MKKLISLFLAMLMIFSVVTVAFAADDVAPGEGEEVVTEPTTEEPTPEEPSEGGFSLDDIFSFDNIEDMPLWQVKLISKVGKIAIKIIVAFVKVGVKLGFIDKEDVVAKVEEMVGGAFGDLPIDIDTIVGIILI